jgi:hypothetical protein
MIININMIKMIRLCLNEKGEAKRENKSYRRAGSKAPG